MALDRWRTDMSASAGRRQEYIWRHICAQTQEMLDERTRQGGDMEERKEGRKEE